MKSSQLTVTLFTSAIYICFIISICLPDKSFSPIENRSLQIWPSLSIKALKTGEWAKDMETYVIDQFPARDSFIWIKSEMEFLLGKSENNNVFLTSSNHLVERFDEPDYNNIDENLAKLIQWKESIDCPVYTAIIPGQSSILQESLPENAPTYDEEFVIEYINNSIEDTIDMYSILWSHRDEYIYYGTDHHWTTLGAYYGYRAIQDALGVAIIPLQKYDETVVCNDFYGTWYSQSGIRRGTADEIYTYVPNQEIKVCKGTSWETLELYDKDFLLEHDKYALFLGGNHPIVEIEGKGEGRVLFIKDSYTNSMAPFFIEHYEEVHLIDLRYMRDSITEYVKENHIDQVIICYSARNFTEDNNLQLIY